ncbi:YdeI/OmpD-associated family protein [Arthrobacter sp. MSA 4-2]|uniref:YdeI/OmpD-associated family protein n=1 Tax=Arthrobacter sp. MSA 4-2 TaxID=2794349 RepID=UPI0018E86CF6|nr:YdeI/OmpD-associated family protein [Arthrobacter sp. MSA 4-2]MBJ2122643.1 YdeI/OmpD-associated family protein [Arthrobacter sp. MSA 4-2]
MADPASAPKIHAETRQQWRQWLIAHHQTEESAWLVSWKKATGRPALSYDDAVSEALAVGWVDSKPQKLDDERTLLYFSPRKPGSAWSRPNKLRVEQLRREGLMTEAGERVIAEAVESGSWNLLDQVEELVVPDDLEAEFQRYAPARSNWDRFPRSTRRGILEWIVQAKRPETRRTRIMETARLAALNERANQWHPPQSNDGPAP